MGGSLRLLVGLGRLRLCTGGLRLASLCLDVLLIGASLLMLGLCLLLAPLGRPVLLGELPATVGTCPALTLGRRLRPVPPRGGGVLGCVPVLVPVGLRLPALA